MKPTDMPKSNPAIELREDFDDAAVLFDPNTTDAVGINPVGVALWRRLDGTRTLNDLVAEIREAFTDVPDTVDDEVGAFVDTLKQRGFVAI